MSGAIGRQYLIQTWNGASEYSGEMVGQRNKASTRMYLDNGKANIAAFSEEEPKKGRQKKEIPLEYRLFPQQRRFDNLEALIKEVEDKYLDGQMSDEEFNLAMDSLETKLERAWYLLCKAKGWHKGSEDMDISEEPALPKTEKEPDYKKATMLCILMVAAFLIFF